MEYLYGDSTPSSLTMDYVDFLARALDCFVPVIQAEQRMEIAAARGRQLRDSATREVARLKELEQAASRAVAGFVADASPDAAVTRCADAITRAASAAVATTTADLETALASETKRIEESADRERSRCVKAVERLLLVHDLPGTENEVTIASDSGEGHRAKLASTTPYGITAHLELEIPVNSVFGDALRVSDVVESLEIHVPKPGNWIRKEGRLAAEKLGRLLVTSAVLGSRSRQVSLRTDALDEGYDFVASGHADGQRVQATRVSPGNAAPAEFELAGDADLRAVEGFLEKLASAARKLASHRKALLGVEIDGTSLEKHPQPSQLVHRLIEVMGPTVREIVARSGSEHELILRLKVGDGRREERYIRRADLLAKLQVLPLAHRLTFSPLGLGEILAPPPAEPASEEISSGFILDDQGSGTSDSGAHSNGDPSALPPPVPSAT